MKTADEYTPSELSAYIKDALREFPTQKAFADHLDISQQYLGDILRGDRDPGEKVIKALGFEKVVTYRKVGVSDATNQ